MCHYKSCILMMMMMMIIRLGICLASGVVYVGGRTGEGRPAAVGVGRAGGGQAKIALSAILACYAYTVLL